MPNPNEEKFKEYWKQTEVIREYHRTLFTFGDMELPYVFAGEHPRFGDRIVVRRGVVFIRKPFILLPGQRGPEFGQGFEHVEGMPREAAYMLRMMGLPHSQVTNRPIADERIELGRLQAVLDRFSQAMETEEDAETGLIRGSAEGFEVSLMRYSLGLIIKSAPENVREFMEHLRRQRGEPIGPNERISDEDLRRLFG